MEKNTFRVIEIVDEKTILINYGIKHGAVVGDKIQVFENGRKVVDPLSHQSLGNWDFIKDTLTITQSFDLFSVCSKTVTKNILATFSDMSTTTVEPIFVDKESITNKRPLGNIAITVGDLVRKV